MMSDFDTATSVARRAMLSALTLAAWVGPARAQTGSPSVDDPVVAAPSIGELADAPYGTMGMKLERTFLKVDVLALTVRFDARTAERIGRFVSRHEEYDADLETPIAELAIMPDVAVAEIEFLRGVSLDQFIDGIDDDMRRAVDVGWLEDGAYAALRDSLPMWFEFLRERRIQDGDRLSYEVRGDSVRTVFWGTSEGRILLDQTDIGRQNVLALLGAYFAPRSSFRKDLVRSLWKGWDPTDP